MYARLFATLLIMTASVALFCTAPPAGPSAEVYPTIPPKRVFTGETKAMGAGDVTSWVMLDKSGHPISIGITFDEQAITNLPDIETEYPLRLPPQADETPYKEIAVDWQPHGHDPLEYYAAPHFDFHFYMITPAARNLITATGADVARLEKKPLNAYIPTGYISTPGGVPYMGAHWVAPDFPEFHGKPFTVSPIYGFYNGMMVFFESMTSIAFLQTKPNYTAPISQPERYALPGHYPTEYIISYDAARHQYAVSLQGLKYRK